MSQDKVKALLSKQTAINLPVLLEEASNQKLTYEQFLYSVIDYEWNRRQENREKRKLRDSNIAYVMNLCDFDINEITGITELNLKLLSELKWVDGHYNLILFGQTGLGKTHIAVGLGIKAIEKGKRVLFLNADELMYVLKTHELIHKSAGLYKKLRNVDLLIIDDLVQIATNEKELQLFFNIISYLYEKASIIITSNNDDASQWSKGLEDTKILQSILDKLLHKSQVIRMEGESYRLKHRKTIF